MKQIIDLLKRMYDISQQEDWDECTAQNLVQDTANEFWVMELTSFSSAGLYACNVDKIANLLKKEL